MADYKSVREEAHENHRERQRRFGGGVSEREDERSDRKMVAEGVHKHERHMHKGEKETKLKHGGKVEGKRARGGRLDRKKHTTVNIIVGHGQQQQPQPQPVPVPVRQPVPVPVPAGGGGMPPPGAMPPPGGMPMRPPVAGMGPPGAMPPPGMMPRRRGGSVKMTAGAASGEGRLEKTRMVE